MGRERLPTIGLDFYRKVTQKSYEDRTYLLSCQLDNIYHTRFFNIIRWYERGSFDLIFPAEVYEDPPFGYREKGLPATKIPNTAWLRLRGRPRNSDDDDEEEDQLFRKEERVWGYVFWGEERLAQDGVRTKTPS